MNSQNRKSVVISALLTTLALSLIGGGLLFQSGALPLDAAGAAGDSSRPAPVVVTPQPLPVPARQEQAQADSPEDRQTIPAAAPADADVIAAYQTQLDDAYQALEEAYAQIDLLQGAQAPPPLRAYPHEGEDDESDEYGTGKEYARGEGYGHNEHEEYEGEYDD